MIRGMFEMKVETFGKETTVRATTVDKDGRYVTVELVPNGTDDGAVDLYINGERF